jgi:diguanylate cyclase (GGDEF)-like protein
MKDSVRRATGRVRILLLLGGFLAIGFFATSFTSYYVSKREIHESIVDRELPLTSDTVYSEIQKDLVRPIFISSMMASDTFLRDWVIHGERDVPQVTKYLNEVMTRYGAFTSFFVSDQSSIYYHASGKLRKVHPDDPLDVWYYRVRTMQEPYEINVDADQANRNNLTIFINYRVLDYQGRYLGVTGVGLTVDAVRHLLSDYQKRYQRSVYFVSPEGKVILFGDRSFHGGTDLKAVEGLRDIADRVLASPSGSYQYRLDGRDHLLNVRYVPELKWYLFIEKVEDDALSGIRETLYFNMAIGAAFIAVILLLTSMTLRRYQGRLEEMATIDKLTGLINRQAGEVLLAQALAENRRRPLQLSAVMIDIDHFKEVNDRHGHLRGDQVLQHVASLIKPNLREADVACRWGGEEFMLLLKNCESGQGMTIADKLRKVIAATPFDVAGKALSITVSAGVAEANESDTPEHLLDRADRAMYKAKNAGRNRVMSADLSAADQA